jgi:MoaA/NifB/PqqE/SkfB family radical SAM enzyme
MGGHIRWETVEALPRIPLTGNLDITYRCNNRCRHCWIYLPQNSAKRKEELTFDEIRRIVDGARRMGTKQWNFCGGEPMLRSDFLEIFDYVTRLAATFSLNTNGTLITPQAARLLKRKGAKMVSLYGATAEVHDSITRNPGSFEAALRGISYLKEAGAGFIVQLVPMASNLHQWKSMLALARRLSPDWRHGAEWFYLSACGSRLRNAEIVGQRLDPKDLVKISPPSLNFYDYPSSGTAPSYSSDGSLDDRLYAGCVALRRDFYINPYGQMSLCAFVQDPHMLYDLRRGSFEEAWEKFIPSLADCFRGGREYLEGCASCELRSDCNWCDVYGYLEHRRHGAKVDYLCRIAAQTRAYKTAWLRRHVRYYEIAGLTVEVRADLPITPKTFAAKFRAFETAGPGQDTISIHHSFGLPDFVNGDLGREIYRHPPWAIYRKGNSYIYVAFSGPRARPYQLSVFSEDYGRGRIYQKSETVFRKGGLKSLTLFPTDQILLSQVFAFRQGCYIHSAAGILDGQGLLFVGHSEGGKSTLVRILRDRGEILCDDRNIVRRWPDGFRVHGTWSHGEVEQVSPASAPLRAIFFLHKSSRNRIVPLRNPREITGRLLACLIKPFVTAEWWERMAALVEALVREIPCYQMDFDRSGKILPEIEKLVS